MTPRTPDRPRRHMLASLTVRPDATTRSASTAHGTCTPGDTRTQRHGSITAFLEAPCGFGCEHCPPARRWPRTLIPRQRCSFLQCDLAIRFPTACSRPPGGNSLLSLVGLLCCWLVVPFARVLGPALASWSGDLQVISDTSADIARARREVS